MESCRGGACKRHPGFSYKAVMMTREEVTLSPSRKAEGQADQAKAKAQEALDDAADKAKDAVADAADAAEGVIDSVKDKLS